MRSIRHVALFVLFAWGALAGAQEQQFARLGDLKLESGEVLRDCRVGYRTFGSLNAGRSNVIVFPTWFGGSTGSLMGNFIGPGKLADSSQYHVIAVDALGNGVSSSPSNSESQPRMKFPRITIRDMVNSQHRLLTEVLHITHVRAVMGISMGGMQTFQWIVSYPDFMDKAVPIVGSPRSTPWDLLIWRAQLDAIHSDPGWNGGDYTAQPATTPLGELTAMVLTTPARFNQEVPREKFESSLAQYKTNAGNFDANNRIRQAEAVMALDVGAALGGSLERAAAAVKARALVVVARQDLHVNPEPALAFARLISAQTLELDGLCGHIAVTCEMEKLAPAVAAFLAK